MIYRRFAFILAAHLACAAAFAADMRVLESGDFSGLERLRDEADRKNQGEAADYYDALKAFYSGGLAEAGRMLDGVSLKEADWIKAYLRDVLPLREPMETRESEHFSLRLPARDVFLAPYALDALEKAYKELGSDFGLYPENKVPVEIYPTRESFSKASTLSVEILDRSGAIGICKFRRLMIVSPEQLAYGYRWLDTLSHEYVHYLINLKSRGQCPLWLHEGIAKYLETRWRREVPDYLTPGNRTELVRALKSGTLVSFSRMEPSMVYLDNQDQVRLAFSQVSHAAGAIEKMKDRAAIMRVLQELSLGRSRSEAFEAVLGMNDREFEEKWKEILKEENLEESPGSAPDVIRLAAQSSEVDELVPSQARVHVRLGDRLQKAGEAQAALIQYEKALEREPNNPVALVKAARLCAAAGRRDRALQLLERCVKENPNYPTGLILLGQEMSREEKWDDAKRHFEAANALNPFNPAVHQQLARIYQKLGDSALSSRETEAAAALARR